MASLWIRSGYDMKVEMSAETYQVGAHFKALIEAILVAPLKSFERFFCISSFPAGLCFQTEVVLSFKMRTFMFQMGQVSRCLSSTVVTAGQGQQATRPKGAIRASNPCL